MVSIRNQSKIRRYWNDNSQTVREYIEKSYEGDPLDAPQVDFDFVLNASKDAFVLMRYIFESGIPPNAGWLGDVIVEGARKAILEKHPEWEYARQKSPLPEISLPSTALTS
jgi:hypothetical protein